MLIQRTLNIVICVRCIKTASNNIGYYFREWWYMCST